MIKFTDFELKFLKVMNIELQGDHFVNIKNNKIFECVKIDVCPDDITSRYVFVCNSIKIEFYRKFGKPTRRSVFVKSHSKTCYAGEYIDCKMIDTCDCNLSDEYKCRIIGITARDSIKQKTYETYISFEPKIDDGTLKTRIEKYVNGVSYVSPYEIVSTKDEIFDDLSPITEDGNYLSIIANESNYDMVLSKAIESKYRFDRKIRTFYEMYKSFFIESYTRSLECIKNIEKEYKK